MLLQDNKMTAFPTTRYQGSKRKVLPWLYDCLHELEFDSVLDAFGGSGMVSCLFKHMGKHVTYNDLFRFNFIIGESIVENDEVVLTESDVDFILSSQSCGNHFISDTFRGIYYLDDENNWLDSTVQNIESLSRQYGSKEARFKQAIALNALFQSCLVKRPYNLFHRNNLIMRTNDVARSFGNKTTWDKPFPDHFLSFVREINNSVYNSGGKCRAICNDAFQIENKYDLVYLDPPYLRNGVASNESSDYLKCYHFLEGLAKYKQWGGLIDNSTKNKRIIKEYSPNYFTRTRVHESFDQLIKRFRNSIIVLSYRFGGVPTIDELSQIMLKYKDHLKMYEKHYQYALNKQNGNDALNREFLLIGY